MLHSVVANLDVNPDEILSTLLCSVEWGKQADMT